MLRGESDVDPLVPSGDPSISISNTGASNGAGKTSLAMSVAWALSGSLDARIATDGRAIDVAYDGGTQSKGKKMKPAQVTLCGTLNGKKFEIFRKRGKRKSELSFIVDGEDLTAQSQRDTQALIDEQVGTDRGLLQRACFFGQHSASTALLGMTDAKLRTELSPLVQHADLWVDAASACRAEERQLKKDITALEVELRIRESEVKEKENEAYTMRMELDMRRQELQKAKERAKMEESRLVEELGLKADGTYSNRSEEAAALGGKMSQLQEQAQALQEQSVQRTREDAAKLGALEATLVALYERKGTQVQEGANSTDGVSVSGHGSPYAASIAELDAESAVLSEDLQSFAEKYHRLCQALELKPSFPTGETLTPTIPFINSEPEVLRETFTALATSEMQLAQTKKALQSLDDGTLRGHTHVMNSDNSVCITCGQPLDEDACMARREHLQGDQSRLANLVRSNKQRYGSLKELDMVIDVLNKGVAKLASLNEERVAAEVGLAKDEEEKLALEHAITSAKADIKVFNEQHALYDLQYREEYKNIMLKIADLTEKKNIVEAAINQQFEASSALQRVRAEHRAQLERAKERAEEAERMADKASDNLQNARVSVSRLRSQLSTSQREVALSDRLSTLFGTRGIQNYVFSETLQQLETLTNVFLIALSDGELQLALQSAGGEEKGEGGSDSLWATDLTGSDSRRRRQRRKQDCEVCSLTRRYYS